MKGVRLTIALVLGIFLLCCSPYVFGQEEAPPTWDGEINPNDLYKWEIIAIQPTFVLDTVLFYLLNPDQESSIKVVAMLCEDVTMDLLSYYYIVEDKFCSYIFDADRNKYIGECTEVELEEDSVFPDLTESVFRKSI